MRSILMIVILTLCVIGCSNNNDGGDDVESTTLEGKESSILLPPGPELKAQGYNDEYVQEVMVANTPRPDYTKYRKAWKRVNEKPLHEGYKLVSSDNLASINLDELTFEDAFELQHRVKGEGHKFWWRGEEFTTDYQRIKNPSVDEE